LKSAQPKVADQAAPFPLGLEPYFGGTMVVPSRALVPTFYQFFN
jgi:hypothetical protein